MHVSQTSLIKKVAVTLITSDRPQMKVTPLILSVTYFLIFCLAYMNSCLHVTFSFTDVLVSAVAQLPRGPLLKRGSTITLICNATVTTTGPAQAQVQWLRWPIPVIKKGRSSESNVNLPDPAVDDTPRLVAALMYDGVAVIYANSSEVSVDRLSAVTYRLRVHTAMMEDQGMYACHAEAWGQDPHGGWYNTGARAESNAVTVYLYARGMLFLLTIIVIVDEN